MSSLPSSSMTPHPRPHPHPHRRMNNNNKYNKDNNKANGDPLAIILAAQNGFGPGYFPTFDVALKEMQRGQKLSCWMWYIFPSYQKVRRHRMDRMLLQTLHQHVQYLQHPILGPRLIQITQAAYKWLNSAEKKRNSPSAEFLFGSTVDRNKFHETCTAFAVAAVLLDAPPFSQAAQLFVECACALGGLVEPVLRAFLAEQQLPPPTINKEHVDSHLAQVQEALDQVRTLAQTQLESITTKSTRTRRFAQWVRPGLSKKTTSM